MAGQQRKLPLILQKQQLNKIVLNKAKIVPGEVVNFQVEMKTPEYEDGETDTLTATNVFYTNRDAENPTVFVKQML